jgi:hypothetical protein
MRLLPLRGAVVSTCMRLLPLRGRASRPEVTGELRASRTCKCSSAHHGARAGPFVNAGVSQSGSRRRLHGRLLPKMKLAPDPQHEHPRADRAPASRHTKQRAALHGRALSRLSGLARCPVTDGDAALRGRPRHGREARRCCRDDRVPDHICPVCPGSLRCFCIGNNVSTARSLFGKLGCQNFWGAHKFPQGQERLRRSCRGRAVSAVSSQPWNMACHLRRLRHLRPPLRSLGPSRSPPWS